MLSRLWNRFTYWMERAVVRGAHYRLLLIAPLIGLLSVFGGALVLWWGSGFADLGGAVWWAFLRLTDPGYLGDDVGVVNRTISTVLTVAGYVVFLGALVAVMTQWLNARMQRLERGLTPVARNDHILILGWTNRTDSIVREILTSEDRVKRFLRVHGTGNLHIVVMAENVDARLAQDLRDAVGEAWDEREVTLRSGSPLRMEHLARVDHLNAAVVIVPGAEFTSGSVGRTDSHTLKTLLSLSTDPSSGRRSDDPDADLPLVVAEIFDARKVGIARKAYPGPLQIISSDEVVSRLLAQNVRHPRLSHVYYELLTHGGGSEIYLRQHPELDGQPFAIVGKAFQACIPLGVVRQENGRHEPYLNPPAHFRVRASDRLVHLAESQAHTERAGPLPDEPLERGRPGAREDGESHRRILVLGWNHRVPALVHEFDSYPGERFDIRMLATVPSSRREKAVSRYGPSNGRVRLEHVEGDYTDIADLRQVHPEEHDTVLIVGSDWTRTEEEADARSIVGTLLLNDLGVPNERTRMIVELLDPDNLRLLGPSRGEVVISPLIVSHMLAHVALRPELGAVFEELFTSGGAEITFQPLERYRPDGGTAGEVTFAEVQRAAYAHGEIALGVQAGMRTADLVLNPPADRRFQVREDVEVVTLVTYD